MSAPAPGGGVRAAAGDGDTPALTERLGLGSLLAGMGLGLAVQFALAWAWAHPAAGPPPLALGGGILLATLARNLGSIAKDDGGADNEIAWIGLLLGSGLAVAFMRLGPQAGVPAALAVASVWAAWWMTGYLWRNLLTAVPALRDPSAGPQRDAHGQPIGSGSLDIAANVQAGAFGGVLAAALVAVLGLQIRHGHGGPPLELGALAMALQAACACLLVAQGQRRALLREARVYQATVLPGFAAGSAAGALAVTLALTALAVILPAYPSLLTPHGVGTGLARVVGGVVGHTGTPGAVPPTQGAALPQRPATTGGGGGHLAGQSGVTSALTVVAVIVVLVVLGFGLRLGWSMARDAFGRRVSLLEFLRDAWQALLDLLAALFSGGGLVGLWNLLFRSGIRRAPARAGERAAATRRPSLLERMADPRLRVRAAYRHMLAGVGGKGHRRPPWFSPGRFRRQLQPLLPRNHPELSRLTSLYEEARYSTHDIATGAAGEAETAAQAVVHTARAARDAGGPES